MMIKANLLPLGLAVLSLTGCATSPKLSENPAKHANESSRPWKQSWTQRLEGFISELNISANGKALLIATVPDREGDSPAGKPSLIRLNAEGKRVWSIATPPVRVQAISPDGEMAVVSNYDDKLVAYNSQGKALWSADTTCRPFLLAAQKKIVCYHDEDAESDIAFDVFDWNGKKLLSFPVGANSDVLVLKISPDQRNILLGLTGGQLVLIGPDFHSRWHRSVPGEIVDASVSSGKDPRVAVLYDRRRKKTAKPKEMLASLNHKGKLDREIKLSSRMEQAEITSAGNQILLYGNTSKGQVLAAYSANPKNSLLKLEWSHQAEPYASYSSNLLLSNDLAIIGFDDTADPQRHSHITIYDLSGKLLWDIPLLTEEGAFLYVQDYAPEAKLLVVGMDDGSLKAFQLE